MKLIPQLMVALDGLLIDKLYFPNEWLKTLNFKKGAPIDQDLYDLTIGNYKKGDNSPKNYQLGSAKVVLNVEPSDQIFHISFELMSEKSISGRKDILNRYQLLVEAANDVIFEIDLDGRFTYMNPAAMKMSGFKPQDIIGKPFVKLVREIGISG